MLVGEACGVVLEEARNDLRMAGMVVKLEEAASLRLFVSAIFFHTR